MSGRFIFVAVGLALSCPQLAAAEAEVPGSFLDDEGTRLALRRAPNLSTELLDPGVQTRFHLTTRVSPSTAMDTFSDDTRWTFEANAVVQANEHFAISGGLPFGLAVPPPGPNTFFIGNAKLGMVAGGHLLLGEPVPESPTPRLGLGGAFDVYLPTASAGDPEFCQGIMNCDPVGLVRDMRAYEPELFTDEAMFFRIRAHADVTISVFTAELEVGLSPGFTTVREPSALLLLGWAGRASVKAGPYVEPYVEAGSSIQLIGEDEQIILNPDRTPLVVLGRDLTTPVLLTLGLRAHFESFDPALFASIDLRDGLVIFGLDLAGALRRQPRSDRDSQDFFRGMDSDLGE